MSCGTKMGHEVTCKLSFNSALLSQQSQNLGLPKIIVLRKYNRLNVIADHWTDLGKIIRAVEE